MTGMSLILTSPEKTKKRTKTMDANRGLLTREELKHLDE